MDEYLTALGYELTQDNPSTPTPVKPAQAAPSQGTPTQAILNVPPEVTARIIDKILLQSGGVGLGIIIAGWALLAVFQKLGAGQLIQSYITKMEESTEAVKALVRGLDSVSKELNTKHYEYVDQHEEINKNVDHVKAILKEDIGPAIRNIEKDMDKIRNSNKL